MAPCNGSLVSHLRQCGVYGEQLELEQAFLGVLSIYLSNSPSIHPPISQSIMSTFHQWSRNSWDLGQTWSIGILCCPSLINWLLLSLQIYIWQLKDNDLVGVAFIDTNIYIHQLLSIKSLILVADVYKSISLLRFQEEYRTLSLVSRVCWPSCNLRMPVIACYRYTEKAFHGLKSYMIRELKGYYHHCTPSPALLLTAMQSSIQRN